MLKDFRSIFIPICKDFRGKTELSFPEIMFHFPVNVHSCTGGGFSAKFRVGVCRPQFQNGTVG